MAEFLQLTSVERLDALNVAANASGLPPHLLEKDIWVVWALRHLFAGPHAQHLVFKGGTSLSKAYGVIRRFSEDVDLTYDIRAIAGDLVAGSDVPLPSSRSQEKKWSREIRVRLAGWVNTEIVPRLRDELERHGLPATVRAEHDKVFIEYAPLVFGTGYVAPAVMLEFGARSTGEPSEPRAIRCDAAAHLQGLEFPSATPQSVFFAEKYKSGDLIDYHAAVSGGLQLVPREDALAKLAADYRHMVDDGLLLVDAEPFTALLERCRLIEQKANAIRPPV